MDFDWTEQAGSTPAPQQQPAKQGFEPLPPGEYAVVISEQRTKPNKAGTGEYLELTLVIEEGSSRGRRIWERLNLRNPSQKAVQIARETVERIKEVTGMTAARNADELVGGRCRVVTMNDDYGTKVKNYLPPKAKPAPVTTDDDMPF